MLVRKSLNSKKSAAWLWVGVFLCALVIANVPMAGGSSVIAAAEAGDLVGGLWSPSSACGIAVGSAAILVGVVAGATTAGLGAALVASIGVHAAAAICI